VLPRQAQYFHLSCHGRADTASPLNAALAMARGPLTLRDILDRRLGARVGVLSACETAIPGDELPDEVVALPTDSSCRVPKSAGYLWAEVTGEA
jgi:CHAT domain-containing protein